MHFEQDRPTSIPVETSNLADVIARYRYAYLMTTTANGAPHAVAVFAVLQDGALIVDRIGRRTRENALARPAVGLVWPPESADDYSLIVDGHAEVVGEQMRIVPTRAVLHRSAPSPRPPASGACGSDCVELEMRKESPDR